MGYISARDSMKGTLREGSFTGDAERYVKQGSEMCVCFHRGPAFGEHGGALLSYDLLTQRNFYEVFGRYAKCPVNECLSPSGPCWGNWRWSVCRDF